MIERNVFNSLILLGFYFGWFVGGLIFGGVLGFLFVCFLGFFWLLLLILFCCFGTGFFPQK